MNDLNDMVIFAKVAEFQGISSAARALGMPKSRVSRRIALLENALGVRLLERTTRAVHLTEVGGIYYQHCKRIAEEAMSAQESVNQMLEVPRGHLSVSASVAIGQYLIAPHLGEFIESYPEVEVEIVLNNRRVDVIAEGFDLVIRVGELQDSTLIGKHLGVDNAKMFASRDYLKKVGVPKGLTDLHDHRFVTLSGSPHANQWVLIGPENQKEVVPIHTHISVNDLTMIRHMASDGVGIALLPSYMKDNSMGADNLQQVLPGWQSPPFHYHALYPSRRGVSLKVKAWLSFFENKFQKSI